MPEIIDETIVIKRYPNRKLYDTQAKKYITLEAIEQLIRAGKDVRVLDNETGDDITTLTLSNIILETQKKPGGLLPKFVFTELIQRGGQKMFDVAKGVVGRVFGASPDLERRIRGALDHLVEAGRLGRDQAESVLHAMIHTFSEGKERVESAVGDRFEGVLHRLNLPTSGDMDRIQGAIDRLESRVKEMDGGRKVGKRKSSPRKKSAEGAD